MTPEWSAPGNLHVLVEHQTWARVQPDGTAVVGITALGIRLSGEIYMCRPKGPGSVVGQAQSMAVVELAKSIVSVKSPVSGTIVAVNANLAERPQLVHQDPYGAGWIAHLQLSAWDADRAALVSGAAMAPAMAAHAALFRVD